MCPSGRATGSGGGGGGGGLNDPIGRRREDAPVICSLSYRAPELLFASPFYASSNAVDMWSAGCIFAELLTERPMFFPAVQETDLFFRFALRLGTPTQEDIRDMQLGDAEKTMRAIAAAHALPPARLADTLFGAAGSEGGSNDEFYNASAVRLLEKLLVYSPRKRTTAGEALADSWFAAKEDGGDGSVDTRMSSSSSGSGMDDEEETTFFSFIGSGDTSP